MKLIHIRDAHVTGAIYETLKHDETLCAMGFKPEIARFLIDGKNAVINVERRGKHFAVVFYFRVNVAKLSAYFRRGQSFNRFGVVRLVTRDTAGACPINSDSCITFRVDVKNTCLSAGYDVVMDMKRIVNKARRLVDRCRYIKHWEKAEAKIKAEEKKRGQAVEAVAEQLDGVDGCSVKTDADAQMVELTKDGVTLATVLIDADASCNVLDMAGVFGSRKLCHALANLKVSDEVQSNKDV